MPRPDDLQLDKNPLNVREKLTVLLIMFLINLLGPWKYNHEQKAFFDDVYTLIGLKDRK